MNNIESKIKEIINGKNTRQNLIALLSITARDEFAPVFAASAALCKKHFGKNVFVRGIIEFSNYCRKGCLYCGINKANSKVVRYRIPLQEIIDSAVFMKNNGALTVVLQSGEDPGYDDTLLEAISIINKKLKMAVTVSVGERDTRVYKELKKAGAERYLMRIETTDPALFRNLHPDDDLEYRKKRLYALDRLGFEVGTGIMVGLPGQSLESIADDLLFFKKLKPAMVGIGPFLAHEETVLKDFKNSDIFPTLKVLALIRLILPRANLPATTAMGTITPDGRQQALKIGANVIMPNFTPSKYRESYKLYDNKICISEEYGKCAACTAGIAMTAGKRVVRSKGYFKKK